MQMEIHKVNKKSNKIKNKGMAKLIKMANNKKK